MSANFELKARCPDLALARERARAIATRWLGVDQQVDTYFKTAAGRFKLRESTLSGAQLVPYLRPDAPQARRSDYVVIPLPEPERTKQLLAELLMLRGVPHRAALLLEQAIADKRLTPDAKSFELLSNCWIVARDYEKAIEPLTRASELDTTGELYVRLAQLYAQQEDWSDAVDALQRGVAQLDEAKPEAVATGLVHLVDETRSSERREQPRDGARVDPRTPGDLVRPELDRVRERVEHRDRPLDGLHPACTWTLSLDHATLIWATPLP